MNSPSQEIHHERSWLDLDRGQEQHTSGQQEGSNLMKDDDDHSSSQR
jgi:hypothetical protein